MKILKGLLLLAGFIIVLGAIGSCELEVISLGKSIKMCLVGMPMMFIGGVGL